MRKLVSLSRGFSLVEIAIALVVVGVLSAGALKLLVTQRTRAANAATREALDTAKEALFAYAQVNRGLPCAAPDAAGIAAANCAATLHGFIPWRTLGLSEAQSQDANGISIRYLVTPALSVILNADGSVSSSKLSKITAAGDVFINDNSTVTIPKSAVAFALWSVGPDLQDASETAASNEVRIGSAINPVDDVVSWGSRYVLVARILQAGQLLELN